MKKFFKFLMGAMGIFAVLFVVILIGAGIYISIKYPPSRLKAMATDKLSQALKRKVTIGDIHFNVLSGFEITDLRIGNRPGWSNQDFVVAKNISISYHLIPLLWGQISLGEVNLNKPQILIERRGLNQFNFSDIATSATMASRISSPPDSFSWVSAADAATVTSSRESSSQSHKTGLLLSINSLKISHGLLVYLDETTNNTQRSDLTDLNFEIHNISTVGGLSTFTLNTPINYDQLSYQLSLNGSYRYFLASQSIKALSLQGTVNDLGFDLSGNVLNMIDDFSPDMNGNASLNMLKFSGLVPQSLSSMPPGLTLSGPAKVDFHLTGSVKNGLELKGTADASDMLIQYKDLFVKSANAPCKLEFDSIRKADSYDLPSFHAVFQNWVLDGSFHYHDGVSYSGEVYSQALPLDGLSEVVPRLKNVKITGAVAMHFTCSQLLDKPSSFKTNGQIVLKGVGVTLPDQESYIKNLNSIIDVTQSAVKINDAMFDSFDGTGLASLKLTLGKTLGYEYAFDLKNVNAQKAIDASVDAYVTVNPEKYKDKIFGTLNLNYQGSGWGTTSAEMIESAQGMGNYSMVNGKIKGLAAISAINKFFKDKSDEIGIDQIDGKIKLKNKVVSYSALARGRIGQLRVNGAINLLTYHYAPDMTVQCDIHKSFLDSNAIQSQLPSSVQGKFSIDRLADSQGNIPLDFRFTGSITQMPGLNCLNVNRMVNNILNSYANSIGNQIQKAAGSMFNGLFGR